MAKRDLTRNADESEKAIERHLCRLTKGAGGISLKYSSGTATGYPDRILLFPGGRTVWVEVKSAGAHPTRLQATRLLQLRRLGFAAELCASRQDAERIVGARAEARSQNQAAQGEPCGSKHEAP